MSSVLGIDISSRAIDLVKLDETLDVGAEWTRIELEGATSFERCRQIAVVMPKLSWYENVYIAAIERPKTRFMPSAAALFPVFGAVLACLPNELEVWDITPAQWRHGLGLKGNATKDECAIVVDDLRGAGSPDWPQDPIDAYAVAYYTRELNRRGIALDDARQKQLAII